MSEKLEKLKICQFCQSLGNHTTPTCPRLICAECDEKGHAKKDCPYLLPASTIQNGSQVNFSKCQVEEVRSSRETKTCRRPNELKNDKNVMLKRNDRDHNSPQEKYSWILERARQLGSEYENKKLKSEKKAERKSRQSKVIELKQMLRRPHAKCGAKNILSCKRRNADKGEDKSAKLDQVRFRHHRRIVGPTSSAIGPNDLRHKMIRSSETQTTSLIKELPDLQKAVDLATVMLLIIIGQSQTILNTRNEV